VPRPTGWSEAEWKLVTRRSSRAAGDALIAAYPTMAELARANRSFLGRAVRFLLVSRF
jgi:hypothetical protein